MEILSKPVKFGRMQVTKILDKFGKEKIEVKYFSRGKGRSLNFHRFQVIYFELNDWKNFKAELRKRKR